MHLSIDPETLRRPVRVREPLQYVSIVNRIYAFHSLTIAQATHPQIQPGPPELEEMNHRASTVMRLLDDLRRLDAGEDISRKEPANGVITPAEEHPRPPKRPWEDMARDGEPSASASYPDVSILPDLGCAYLNTNTRLFRTLTSRHSRLQSKICRSSVTSDSPAQEVPSLGSRRTNIGSAA